MRRLATVQLASGAIAVVLAILPLPHESSAIGVTGSLLLLVGGFIVGIVGFRILRRHI